MQSNVLQNINKIKITKVGLIKIATNINMSVKFNHLLLRSLHLLLSLL